LLAFGARHAVESLLAAIPILSAISSSHHDAWFGRLIHLRYSWKAIGSKRDDGESCVLQIIDVATYRMIRGYRMIRASYVSTTYFGYSLGR
jgi:hypothetical protein